MIIQNSEISHNRIDHSDKNKINKMLKRDKNEYVKKGIVVVLDEQTKVFL